MGTKTAVTGRAISIGPGGPGGPPGPGGLPYPGGPPEP
jgi:hypothetical protein